MCNFIFMSCSVSVLSQSLKLVAKEFKFSTFNRKKTQINATWQPSVCPAVADPVPWANCYGGETKNTKLPLGTSHVNAKLVRALLYNRVTETESSAEQHTYIISQVRLSFCVDVAVTEGS